MNASDNKTVPANLERYTADEVAECLPYQKFLTKEESSELYRKLWGFLELANNPTPQGGDGSNGTVEEPSSRLDLANDDKAGHWWHLLEVVEQDAIAKGYQLALEELDYDDRDITGQDGCDGSTPAADTPTHEY